MRFCRLAGSEQQNQLTAVGTCQNHQFPTVSSLDQVKAFGTDKGWMFVGPASVSMISIGHPRNLAPPPVDVPQKRDSLTQQL